MLGKLYVARSFQPLALRTQNILASHRAILYLFSHETETYIAMEEISLTSLDYLWFKHFVEKV